AARVIATGIIAARVIATGIIAARVISTGVIRIIFARYRRGGNCRGIVPTATAVACHCNTAAYTKGGYQTYN
ncbi:hypothetical protein, partial [Candidatus Avelusimicrobium alvi]